MMNAARRCWWQPAGFDYTSLEMGIMRLLFAITLFFNIKWETRTLVEQKFPHGLARLFDFTWLAHHPPGIFWQAASALLLIPYVLGRLSVASLALISFFALSIGTLVTSQSKNVNHTWQLVTLVLGAQLLTYLYHGWKAGRLSEWLKPAPDTQRVVIHASLVVIAASYVVSGVTKLINSNGLWIQKVPLLSVQLMKSNWAQYYDTLQPVPGWLEKATSLIIEYPNVARLFFGGGLLIELTAFVLLINRRWALLGGIAIILFHLSVSKVMQLDFEYHMALAFIFCVNLPGLKKTLSGASSSHA
jgi:hypothetical protein